MQQLAQDIKNQSYKKCYLLYGEEDYLRKQYKDRLLESLMPDGDTMNYNYYAGKDVVITEVIDQAETMPFFADRRVILLEDTGFCKAGGEQLAAYLDESPDTTIIIMVESAVDKRSKLFKSFTSNGRAIDFMIQPPETLRKWILGRVKKEGKNIDVRALDEILERTGTDMTTISVELEKLFSYTIDRPSISLADINEIITVSTSAKVFDMIAAMADKKQSQALAMYQELLANKETPFGILALITRQFNMMLQVWELKEERYPSKKIAEMIGIPPFVEQKYEAQIRKYSYKQLRSALNACAIADESVKIKGMNPVLSVELLIIEYSK